MRLILILLAILVTFGSKGQGLIGVSDHIKDYARLLEIKGLPVNNPIIFNSNQAEIWQYDSIPYDSLGPWKSQLANYKESEEGGMSIYFLSPRIDYTYNSKYSRSYNDGPLWSGRGSTVGLNVGFKLKWGPITAQLYPNFFHAQNKHFQRQSPGRIDLNPRPNPLNYQLSNRIDWVQIFGFESFNTLDWGQSNIGAEFGPVKIMFSTENMWWGPALHNPILMSNTAPGFKKVNIGTSKPILTKYGDFEMNAIWGRLAHSDYAGIPLQNKRYIAGVTFGYRPSFIPALKGLSMAFGRVLYKPWPNSGLTFGDIFLALGETKEVTSNGDALSYEENLDQYLSFDLRWIFPKSDAEFYFEWTRNDFWLNFNNLNNEPVGAFSLGIQKVLDVGSTSYKLGIEHTSMAAQRTRVIQESHDYYTHSGMNQGYTHEGSLLGAPIGPGSKSQTIKIDRFRPNGKLSFSINRIRFNDNFFWRTFNDFQKHDVEWNFGFQAIRFFKQFEFSGKFIYSRRMNWHYFTELDVNNFQLLTSVRWHISAQSIWSSNKLSN